MSLECLSCNNTKITSLDLKNCVKLYNVVCDKDVEVTGYSGKINRYSDDEE